MNTTHRTGPNLDGATDDGHLETLQETLSRRAEADGLLDLGYRVVDSPIGPLLLAGTERGLVRVAFAREDHAQVLARLAELVGPRILPDTRRLDEAARQLDQYFERRRHTFDLPLDRSLSHGFRLRVVEHLSTIAYGRTESYGEVAAATGSPRAVRAVGSACATNPLPVVVPCHRVLRSDGGLSGYLGGPENKRLLLELEAG